MPIIRATLQNPRADREHRRAALKACTILGETAAPAIPDVAAELAGLNMTAEAALALSFLGREAFAPLAAEQVLPALKRATADRDPDVAREAGLAIVKLQGSTDAHAR